MRPGNVFSGAAFRVAALSLIVFAAVMLVAGAAITSVVRDAVERQIRSQIAAEVVLFSEIYRSGGEAALRRALTELERAGMKNRQVAGFFSEDGEPLAGGFSLRPDFVGWGVMRHETALQGDDGRYQVNVVQLGRRKLVVGRNMDLAGEVTKTLQGALLVAGFIVTLVIVALGYFVSSRVLGRLSRMALVLGAVSRGDDQARLEVRRGGDQIDHISKLINAHLDRLSALMNATRNAVTAIAHDLRTPLGRASLTVQEAQNAAEKGENPAQALEKASGEIAALSDVFDTILRIARIAGTDDRSAFTALSAGALLRDIAETYQPVLEEEGRSLTLDAPEDGPLILGDRQMLDQLFANLFANISRHTPPGTSAALSLSAADERVTITLADTGPGLPEAMREAPPAPFRQIAVMSGGAGAGLGLAMVRAVADRHKAALRLSDNAPGLRVELEFTQAKP